jgi:raffinose/stachyose/melibiose transport system permease protein
MSASTVPVSVTTPATTATTPDRASARPGMRRSGSLVYNLMLFPAVALFTVFITVPAIVGMVFSFTDYAGFGAWKWIGFANYRSLFHDSTILGSYRFTIGFAIATTIVVNVIALALAIGLSSKIHLKRTLRSIFFVPMVLSGIIIAFVFQYIFSSLIPNIATSIGWAGGQQSLLASQHWAWLGVVIVTAWQAVPGAMIIYLAGLLAIPREVYEAAEVDGANAWRRLCSVTLPLIAGYVVINSVLSIKNFLNAYDIIVGLTGGGPGTSTTSVAMSIFNGFNSGDYAYDMANAVIFFIVTVVISLLQLRLLKGREVSL